MIIKSSEFITSAVKLQQYPEPIYPEVAFCGRSNVGKSSLINVLLNRKRLVKISSTPGHTQLINFFLINNMFSFVDLPGYGYAKVPLEIKRQWRSMIEVYFKYRRAIKVAVVIMDIRREPRKEEFNLINWLKSYRIPLIIVLTKTDKLSKNKILNQLKMINNIFCSYELKLILFSAKTRIGRDSVWSAISSYLEN